MANELEQKKHVARCFYLLSTLLKLGQDLQSAMQKKRVSLDIAGAVLSFLLAKSMTTAEAVREVCQKGYCKDALVLVRTVFEAALWAMDIFRVPDLALEKATAYIMGEPIDRRDTLRKMLSLVTAHESQGRQLSIAISPDNGKVPGGRQDTQVEDNEFSAKLREALDKAEQQILQISQQYEVRESLLNYGKTKVYKLADDAGLLSLYHSFYWEASLYAHNKPRSAITFVKESETGWDFFWGPDGEGRDDVMLRLCHFLWYILKQFDSYFELGQDDTILKKWRELEDLCGAALELGKPRET